MVKTYQDFLEEKHASMVTDDKLINQTVSDLLGVSVASKKRIIAGEVNEVYEVTLNDGRIVIARISHRDNNPFEIEKWAIDACRLNGVPAPRILGVTSFLVGDEVRWMNLEEKLEGDVFDELLNTYSKRNLEVEKWCRQIGEIMSNIHEVKTNGVGRVNGKFVGEYNSWAELIDNKFKGKERLEKIVKRESLPNGIIDRAFEILRTRIEVESCLLHHDLTPRHFFINNGKVSGIIDFEGVWSGDAVSDFAWWDFWRGETLPVSLIVQGYTNKARIEENFHKRLKVYRVYLGIEMISWYADSGHQSAFDHSKNQLVKDLK